MNHKRKCVIVIGLALVVLMLSAGCSSRKHAAQRTADAIAYTEHARLALEQGRTADAETHLRAVQIQHGAALGALGFSYDPDARPAVPAEEGE